MIISGIKVAGQIKAVNQPSIPASDTLMLLNFNGTNGATTTIDSSVYANTVTLTTATISTSQFKFGGSSINVTTQNSAYNVAGVQAIGTDDFCLEGWARMSSSTNQAEIIVLGYTNPAGAFDSYDLGVVFEVVSVNTYRFRYNYRVGVTLNNYIDVTNISLNTWYHWAMTRQSGTLRFFKDGILLSSATSTQNYGSMTWRSSFSQVVSGNRRSMIGFQDDVRLVRGHSIYTANFTPPTSQLGIYTD